MIKRKHSKSLPDLNQGSPEEMQARENLNEYKRVISDNNDYDMTNLNSSGRHKGKKRKIQKSENSKEDDIGTECILYDENEYISHCDTSKQCLAESMKETFFYDQNNADIINNYNADESISYINSSKKKRKKEHKKYKNKILNERNFHIDDSLKSSDEPISSFHIHLDEHKRKKHTFQNLKKISINNKVMYNNSVLECNPFSNSAIIQKEQKYMNREFENVNKNNSYEYTFKNKQLESLYNLCYHNEDNRNFVAERISNNHLINYKNNDDNLDEHNFHLNKCERNRRKKKLKCQEIKNAVQQNLEEFIFENEASVNYDFLREYLNYKKHKNKICKKHKDKNVNKNYFLLEKTSYGDEIGKNFEFVNSEENNKKKNYEEKNTNDDTRTFDNNDSSCQIELPLLQENYMAKQKIKNMADNYIADKEAEKTNYASVTNEKRKRAKKHKKQKIRDMNEQNFNAEFIFENGNASLNNRNQQKCHIGYADEIRNEICINHKSISYNNNIQVNKSVISEHNSKRSSKKQKYKCQNFDSMDSFEENSMKENYKKKDENEGVCTHKNNSLHQNDVSLLQSNNLRKENIKNMTDSYIIDKVPEITDYVSDINEKKERKKKHKKQKIRNMNNQSFEDKLSFEPSNASLNNYNQHEYHIECADEVRNEICNVNNKSISCNNNIHDNNFKSIISEHNFKKQKHEYKNSKSMDSSERNGKLENCRNKDSNYGVYNSDKNNSLHQNDLLLQSSSITKQSIENMAYSYISNNVPEKTDCISDINEKGERKKKHKKKTRNMNKQNFKDELLFGYSNALLNNYNQEECHIERADEVINEICNVNNKSISCNNNIHDNNFKSIISEQNPKKKFKKHKYKSSESLDSTEGNQEANYKKEDSNDGTYTSHKKKSLHQNYLLQSNSVTKQNIESMAGSYITDKVPEKIDYVYDINEKKERKKKHEKQKIGNMTKHNFEDEFELSSASLNNCNQEECHIECVDEVRNEISIVNQEIISQNNNIHDNNCESIISKRNSTKKKHKYENFETMNSEGNSKKENDKKNNVNDGAHTFDRKDSLDQSDISLLQSNCMIKQKVKNISDGCIVPEMAVLSLDYSSNINERKKCKKQKIGKMNKQNFEDADILISDTADSNVQELVEMGLLGNVLDCTEDPTDFEIPPLHVSETVSQLTKSQKLSLVSEGISIKTGRFTVAEDNMIIKNFNGFVKKYKISDPFELFGIGRYTKDYNILKFIKAKHFYAILGKGLNDRTLYTIYKRARLLLNPYRNSNKFDNDDIKAVKQLQTQIGSKWNLIGDALQKSGETCLQAHRWHKDDTISKGGWTNEERLSLIEAIKTVSGSSDISCDSIKGISWEKVASHVPTRNFSQCRMYWANHLAWKENSLKQKWNKECYHKLIQVLNKSWNVDNTSVIDWEKMHEHFVDVAPSPIFLQKRWLYLKSQIPRHKSMTYKEIVKELCIKYNVDICDK